MGELAFRFVPIIPDGQREAERCGEQRMDASSPTVQGPQ